MSRRRAYHGAKRLIDIVVSSILLVLTSPAFVVLIVLVRLDSSGPALFRQERVGRDGSRFRILKFRTMDAEADESFHRDHYVELASNGRDRHPICLSDDERVTRFGGFMRRWSLDELPNLWNVLVGDMSLVGPRPLVPYEVDLLDDYARRRLEVKPGMTGLAQVSGRSNVSIQGRADLDVAYVQTQSFSLDAKILLRTLPTLIRNCGD